MACHPLQPTTARLGGARRTAAIVSLVVMLCACSGGGDDESGTTMSSTASPTTTPAATSASTSTTAPSSTTSAATSSTTSTPTSTTAPADCTTLLEHGCETEFVRNLQRLLQRKIDRAVVVDGKFGDQTDVALRKFERSCGKCVEDGRIRVNGVEWTELNGRDDLPIIIDEGSPG